MHSTDVFISGGGPAGLAAAIACRLQGFDVLVADCSHPPIDKPCGEGLLPDALTALETLGVTLDPAGTAVFRGIRFIEGHTSATADFSHGLGRGVRRTTLHEALHQRAASLGARFLWNTQALSLTEQPNLAVLETASGPVQANWVIGADGLNSRIRLWSGLDRGSPATTRIGLRTHLRIAPWSEYTEVYWSHAGQAYITPIASDEIGLAIVARDRRSLRSIDHALQHFPTLATQLALTARAGDERGAATLTRTLPRVTSGRVALLGDASGSVDAVTGEGLGLAFHQALALAPALRAADLAIYERRHREISRRPTLMSRALLLLDRHSALRHLTLHSFSQHPELFARMLALHTGDSPCTLLGLSPALRFRRASP